MPTLHNNQLFTIKTKEKHAWYKVGALIIRPQIFLLGERQLCKTDQIEIQQPYLK